MGAQKKKVTKVQDVEKIVDLRAADFRMMPSAEDQWAFAIERLLKHHDASLFGTITSLPENARQFLLDYFAGKVKPRRGRPSASTFNVLRDIVIEGIVERADNKGSAKKEEAKRRNMSIASIDKAITRARYRRKKIA